MVFGFASEPQNGPGGEPSAARDAQWQDHEHLAAPVQIEAEKLLDQAGSPALAKQAIDAAAQHKLESNAREEKLAEQWGFPSRGQLLASSVRITAEDGTTWWATSINQHRWFVWNEQHHSPPAEFASLEDAMRSFSPGGKPS